MGMGTVVDQAKSLRSKIELKIDSFWPADSLLWDKITSSNTRLSESGKLPNRCVSRWCFRRTERHESLTSSLCSTGTNIFPGLWDFKGRPVSQGSNMQPAIQPVVFERRCVCPKNCSVLLMCLLIHTLPTGKGETRQNKIFFLLHVCGRSMVNFASSLRTLKHDFFQRRQCKWGLSALLCGSPFTEIIATKRPRHFNKIFFKRYDFLNIKSANSNQNSILSDLVLTFPDSRYSSVACHHIISRRNLVFVSIPSSYEVRFLFDRSEAFWTGRRLTKISKMKL